jgi:hypothetical protein
MGLLDKNGDLVIDGQRIRSYNNLKDRQRVSAKDGFLRFDKRTLYWYFDADDGTQEAIIDGDDYFGKRYGFEKIEEISEANRRMEREKRVGYPKCYVCNIMKPRPIFLYLEKKFRFWEVSGKKYW